jgi:hypothetical protein
MRIDGKIMKPRPAPGTVHRVKDRKDTQTDRKDTQTDIGGTHTHIYRKEATLTDM